MRLKQRLGIFFFLTLWVLTACSAPSVTATQIPANEASKTPAIVSPTPEPVVSLTVCTATLPDSLFPYALPYNAARDAILSMIRDELFIRKEGDLLPGILTETPSDENGGMQLQPVTVEGGQTVVDARGELVVLKAGISVRPSGCRNADCAITWDGESALQMDQMVLTFHLDEGLAWSDGTPVTANDSVSGFMLASSPDAPGLKWAETRTASYTAQDERTVTWTGKPGFTTSDLSSLFWAPAPSQLVTEGLDWSAISENPGLASFPLSYGPFMIASRSEDELMLTRNPYYFRSDEGLPTLDEVRIRAIGNDKTAAVAALGDGRCDVLDSSFGLENDLQAVSVLQADGSFDVMVTSTGSWQHLVFGITPSSYDEYYNPVYGDRPDFFGDERARQAIAMCLDREGMLKEGLSAVASLWPSFVSDGESQLPEATGLGYDPSAGLALLESTGWRDHDLDPSTPLIAWQVTNVPMGTTFSVNLMTDASPLQQSMAGVVRDSLGQCGIGVTVTSLSTDELYAPGPDGIVFGRKFNLAFIAWQPLPDLDCGLYQSWEIPSDDNQWIGTNIAGLMDEMYDQSCSAASLALPDGYEESLRAAEEAFLETLPAVPLFSLPNIIVVPGDGCSEIKPLDDDFFGLLEYYQPTGTCP